MTIRRRRVLIPLLMAVLLMALASGFALGKAHVPAGEVQVAHRGVVKQIPLQAGPGHLAHGDFYLPACDFANVFMDGDDVSALEDTNGDGRPDNLPNPRNSAEGITPACPTGTF